MKKRWQTEVIEPNVFMITEQKTKYIVNIDSKTIAKLVY